VAVFSAISACSTFETGPFLREQITGDTWRACLAREYQRQARIQVRTGRNWKEATRLAERGRAALTGEAVAPAAGATCACAVAEARRDAAASDYDEALRTCEKSA
jgi:hypothetical protein